MESEKVKEIKKLIRYCADTYGTSKCIGEPKRELFTDILTLINELESENEILHRDFAVKAYDKLRAENKQLKDRIAELEKENESLKGNIVYQEKCKEQLVNACNECNSKIKKFAERLKEKLKARHEVNRLLLMPVRDVVLSTIEGLLEDVDKTLKELINE